MAVKSDDTILYCIADSVQLAIEYLQLSFNVLQDALLFTSWYLMQMKQDSCSSPEFTERDIGYAYIHSEWI